MSDKRFWWMTIEERQRKSREALGKPLEGDDVVKKRKTYVRGMKEYLGTYEVGEIREYNEIFDWHNLRTVASRMKRDYGCLFSFASQGIKKYIVRIL